MENYDQLSRLRFQKESTDEELRVAIQQWATLVITDYLINQAQAVYEKERQPLLAKQANKFLEVMTDNRYYLSITADNELILIDKEKRRKASNAWSSGLSDQVYLAMRFALASEFNKRNEPIPLILDDILVRFDPHRQLGTAKVMFQLSQHQQILLFTCHPEMENILERASNGTDFGVVRLKNPS